MAKGRKTGGRQKGVPNKTTRAVKEALQAAYSKIGDDDALAEWASENRTEFYKLWAKMLPQEVDARIKANVSNGYHFQIDRAEANPPKPD